MTWTEKAEAVYAETKQALQTVFDALNQGQLPKHIMITTHPQRWTDNIMAWSKELLLQSLKNIVKRLLIVAQK